jgi:hypothetical protein
MESVMVELKKATCQRILSFGLKSESYDTIVNRLLDQIVLLRELRSPGLVSHPEYTIP